MIMHRRLVLIFFAALAMFALFDFWAFCLFASKLTPDPEVKGEAAIALTGGSGMRIAAGVELVSRGAVPQLLVSGVHPDVTMDDIAKLGGGPAETYDCCVTLGRMAATTVGNANEAGEWTRENGYGSIILVTSDYHMPRSLILMDQVMPDIDMIIYPVRTRIDPSRPLSSFKTFRSLFQEWMKWRVTKLRSGRDGVVSLR
jgi:uncharacterized SAM-binding protein YcdF (DUF218 family)